MSSVQLEYLSAGEMAIAFAITSSIPAGRSGRAAVALGRGLPTCA